MGLPRPIYCVGNFASKAVHAFKLKWGGSRHAGTTYVTVSWLQLVKVTLAIPVVQM